MTTMRQEAPANEAFQANLPAAGLDAMHALVLLAGMAFAGMGALFAWLMLWADVKWEPQRPPLLIVFVLPVPFMVMGLLAMVWGIITASESVELRVEEGTLRVTRRGMLGRRVRVFPRGELVNLSLIARLGPKDASSAATMVARLQHKPRQKLFARYGLAEMTRMRDALRAVLWPERLEPGQELVPPPGGYLMASADGDAVRIHMGPEPVGQVLQGTYYVGFVFALVVPAFCAVVVGGIMKYHGDATARIVAPAMGGFVAMVFLGIGVALIVWARRTALREAQITIAPEKLAIEVTGPGDPEHRQWSREQIFGVRMGPSGTSVNSQVSQQFQVVLQGGKSDPLFNGRDQEDLEWLAGTIEQVLGIKGTAERRTELLATLSRAAASPPPPAHVMETAASAPTDLARKIDEMLQGSNISRVADPGKLILAVAPRGWKRVPIFLMIFTTLWCLMCASMLTLCLIPSTHTPPAALLFMLPFAGMGLLLIVIMRRMARATARVEVTAQTLDAHWDSMFSGRRASVPCTEIIQVKEGMQTGTDGGSPPQLQILRRNAAALGIMTGYGQEELQKLARAISFALGLESA